jgi:hypothetical protein
MKDATLELIEELLRETFEGGLPGQGTQYLDSASGIRRTLGALTAAQASVSRNSHPSIAGHARHMHFHMIATIEWLQGVRTRRDWIGSFKPFEVNAAEWESIRRDLEQARLELMMTLRGLSDADFVKEGEGLGALLHLAYHLGAIRQLMHEV